MPHRQANPNPQVEVEGCGRGERGGQPPGEPKERGGRGRRARRVASCVTQLLHKYLPNRLTKGSSCDTLVLVGKTKYSRKREKEMEGIIGTRVAMPANPTAWLIANARKGAMLYTREGVTVAIIGAKVTYGDSDKGTQQYPLFAPKGEGKRVYMARPKMPMLD